MQRVEVLIACALICLGGLVLDVWSAQPASRYLLTVAIVDDHTLRLDRHERLLLDDRAERDGHAYSDKAPYQPLLAVPFYAAYRAVGGDAFPPGGDPESTDGFHWGRWWVSFWSATVPAVLLCLVTRRLVAQVYPEVATRVALAMALGTMLLPFTAALFGHVLSTLLVAWAWLILRAPSPDSRSTVVAGVLLSAAVGTEYPAAIVAAVIGVAALIQHGARRAPWLALGGVLGGLPVLIYNWVAFGSPLSTAYQGHLSNFHGSGALGVYNLVPPQLDELNKAMIGNRGLLTLTPICLVAVVAALVAVARRTEILRDGVIALIILLSLWLMSAGIDGYGGSSPGPRYLMQALPFLAVPLALAWRKLPVVCTVAAVVGAVPMLLASITYPLINSEADRPLREWIDRLRANDIIDSVPAELAGRGAFAATLLVGMGFLAAALASDRAARRLGTSVDEAFTPRL